MKKTYIEFILGIIISTIGFVFFIKPYNVIYGGVTGFSLIITNIFNINLAYLVLFFNIALLILSYILLGSEKTIKSVIGSIIYPIILEIALLIKPYIPEIEIEQVFSIVIGAVLCGTGMGLVLKTGFTSGGTDILYQIISKYCNTTLGKASFIIEAIIIALSIFTLGMTNFIYSVLTIYIITKVIDKIVLGISSSKTFLITTNKEDEVRKYVNLNMHVKIHSIKTNDGGLLNKKNLIISIPTKDYVEFKNELINIDKDIQILVLDVYEKVNI